MMATLKPGLAAGLLLGITACAAPPAIVDEPAASPADSTLRAEPELADLPLDRSYSELTPAQRSTLHAAYLDLPVGDEPPFPQAGLAVLAAGLRPLAARIEPRGSLLAVAHIDRHGGVDAVSLLVDTDDRTADTIRLLLLNTTFKPARCAGLPCAMGFPVPLELIAR